MLHLHTIWGHFLNFKLNVFNIFFTKYYHYGNVDLSV